MCAGEEGGVSGDSTAPLLWCVDPVDGTTNFAHSYPSFAVSVAVLLRGMPVAAAVVEFVGGALCSGKVVFGAEKRLLRCTQLHQIKQLLMCRPEGVEHTHFPRSPRGGRHMQR